MAFPQPVRDLVILVCRVLLGGVLIAHGWQKFVTNGMDATTASFTKMGAPLPSVSAPVAGAIELGGGGLLVVGALTSLAGVLVALNMFGAYWLVHRGNGVFAADKGWELVALIGLASLLLAAVGAGRFSFDHLLFGRRGRRGVRAAH